MPRSMWSGTISFGLVAIPVELQPAARSHRSAFRMLHVKDNSPLERRLLCPRQDAYIHGEHVLRGYEVAGGRFVTVTAGELESLAPQRSRTIEITTFVDQRAVGPLYYDRPYYLAPTGPVKPYRLLAEAMRGEGKAGICRFVLHDREHLGVLRVVADALCLLLLRFPQELRSAEGLAPAAAADEKLTARIRRQIEGLKGDFDPSRYKDPYEEAVSGLIAERREKAGTVNLPETEEQQGEEAAEPESLMERLEQSLAQARRKRAG